MNIRLGDGTTRRGQVLEVDGEKAVVQVASFLWILFFLTEEWQSSLLKKKEWQSSLNASFFV